MIHTKGRFLMIFWDVRLELPLESDTDHRALSELPPLSFPLARHPFILHISLFPVGKRGLHQGEWMQEKCLQVP